MAIQDQLNREIREKDLENKLLSNKVKDLSKNLKHKYLSPLNIQETLAMNKNNNNFISASDLRKK